MTFRWPGYDMGYMPYRHVMMMLPNETKRVTRFTNGLIYPIHLVVAARGGSLRGESCLRVVDAAKDVELIRNYKRAYFKLSPYGLPRGSHVFTPKTTTQPLTRVCTRRSRGGTQTRDWIEW
ncbi:hypothetical protein HAX54_036627 [Datura stramonium]|uniref:Uncharacterized protein n=1 Tax=Datura stramonium TaxID=4076 RepID=A0ABS8VIJ3_DATST|nr:hypothetical protein [Datura stramonium]